MVLIACSAFVLTGVLPICLPGSLLRPLLVGQLGVRFLVVGDDFRFGHGREGDFTMLLEAGRPMVLR